MEGGEDEVCNVLATLVAPFFAASFFSRAAVTSSVVVIFLLSPEAPHSTLVTGSSEVVPAACRTTTVRITRNLPRYVVSRTSVDIEGRNGTQCNGIFVEYTLIIIVIQITPVIIDRTSVSIISA
jgi:hypothetical protein